MGKYVRVAWVLSLVLILVNVSLLPDIRLPIVTEPQPPPLSASLVRNVRDWHYDDFTNGTPSLHYLGDRRIGLSDHYSHHVDFAVLSMFNLAPELKMGFEEADLLFHYWNRTMVGFGIDSGDSLILVEGDSSQIISFNRTVVASGGALANNSRAIALLDQEGVLHFSSFSEFGNVSFVEFPLNLTLRGSVERTMLAVDGRGGWIFTLFSHLGDSFTRYRISVDPIRLQASVDMYSYWSEFQFGSNLDGVFPASNGLLMGFSVFEDRLEDGFRYRIIFNSSDVSFVSNKSLQVIQINDTLVFYSFESGVFVDGIPLEIWMVFVRLDAATVVLLPRDPAFNHIFSRIKAPLLGTLPLDDFGAVFLFTGVQAGMELFLILSLSGGSREYYAEQAASLKAADPLAFLEYLGYLYWLLLPLLGWVIDYIQRRRRPYPQLYPLMVEEERFRRRRPPL